MLRYLFSLIAATLFSIVSISQETPFVNGDLIIMLHKGESPELILEQFSSVEGVLTDIEISRELSHLSNIYLFSIDHENVDQFAVLSKIQQHPAVRAAQFNHHCEERLTPNDPGLGNQWHHIDASDNDIDTDLAWDITTGGTTANGDDIVVCVIEGGGSNYNHTDLITNHWTNPGETPGNGVDDDGNGYIDDFNGWNAPNNNDNIPAGGHGTAVSGMIGAQGDNNNGGVGVNWNIGIMQVVVGSLTEANVIDAYNYPYDLRNLYNTTGGAQGTFVVATNASWGIDNANPANYPVWCAYYDDLGSVGILNCGATANNNVNIDVVGDMPTGCSSDYMVAVTATNSSDVRTFSGYGINSIDLGAPGESVYLPSGSTGYSNTSGTSFASPCVAGAIGLLYSSPCPDFAALALTNPQVAADQARDHIFNGVDPVANLATEVATGGRLNIKNSIDLLIGACGPLPPCNPVSHTATASCYYDAPSGNVLAQIEVDVTMSEAFCTVQTVCYSSGGGPVTCDDLVALGVTFSNTNTYTIQGLASSTTYDVYYTTTDGTSASVSVTTPDCISEIPGCTDPSATNYNSGATFDDGSCVFPCSDVTLTIDTDCWGNEVTWDLVQDATGTTVGSGGPYGNQITITWQACLEWGCYTFTIYDSFGDGLDGTASGCAVDGDYNMIDDVSGTVLFQMGVPNYGSQAVHNFCLPLGIPGCTDTAACNYDSTATVDDGSCTYPGCIDTTACNFDPLAGCADTSCLYNDACGICGGSGTTPGCTTPSACNYDSTADCNDGSCLFFDVCGVCGGSGTIPGCTDTNACNYLAIADCDNGSCLYNDACGLCGGSGTIAGCTDPGACNYNSNADCNDGSCQYLDACGVCGGGGTVAGCTNAAACNFNPAADCDNGSCQFADACGVCGGTGTLAGCMNPAACNFNPAADCDDGSCQFLDACGVCGGGGTAPGCTNVAACNYDSTADCDDGSCQFADACGVCGGTGTVAGCTNPAACNYNSAADCDDGSCQFNDACGVCGGSGTVAGCTDSAACNYNPSADCNDGTCDFSSCDCAYDLNNDGIINIGDFLIMLADVGCTGTCVADFNQDGATNTGDVLLFLVQFGSTCP